MAKTIEGGIYVRNDIVVNAHGDAIPGMVYDAKKKKIVKQAAPKPKTEDESEVK